MANALSRKGYEDDVGDVHNISMVMPSWIIKTLDCYKKDGRAIKLLRSLAVHPNFALTIPSRVEY